MPFDRKAYNREYMRRWRARQKERGPKTDPHAACDQTIGWLKKRILELEQENRRLRDGLAF